MKDLLLSIIIAVTATFVCTTFAKLTNTTFEDKYPIFDFDKEVVERVAEVPVEVEKITVDYVWYQDGDIQELDGFYLENGDTVVMLSDDSYALMNHEKNLYTFQPVMLGDWDVEVRDAQQLENIIKTYISMNNNGWY